MNIQEMITEWRKGCFCGPYNPVHCAECTTALIDAIEKKINSEDYCSCLLEHGEVRITVGGKCIKCNKTVNKP